MCQTECVPGSEQYVKTKNGRNAMKCKCAECGITKFRFVKGTTARAKKGKGLLLVEIVHLIKYQLLEQFYKLPFYILAINILR